MLQRVEPVVEVAVAERAVLELADEQERPALADEVERVGDGAVLVVGLHWPIVTLECISKW